MGRYRKIDSRIWNDAKFVGLSDDGKLCFLFLLTHPHLTALGAMRATIQGLASELKWKPGRLSEAFAEAFRKGLVEHDEKASYIGLPNFLRYNGPESPNVVKAWSGALDLIPECALKVGLLERVKGFTEGLPEAFAKALPEAFRKGMPYPEPEPEPEPKQKKNARLFENGEASQPEFEAWYLAYPRHVSKRDAQKAWHACVARVQTVEQVEEPEAKQILLDAATRFAKSPKGRGERKFVPYPATWLNDDRWNDDPREWGESESRVVTRDEMKNYNPTTGIQ